MTQLSLPLFQTDRSANQADDLAMVLLISLTGLAIALLGFSSGTECGLQVCYALLS